MHSCIASVSTQFSKARATWLCSSSSTETGRSAKNKLRKATRDNTCRYLLRNRRKRGSMDATEYRQLLLVAAAATTPAQLLAPPPVAPACSFNSSSFRRCSSSSTYLFKDWNEQEQGNKERLLRKLSSKFQESAAATCSMVTQWLRYERAKTCACVHAHSHKVPRNLERKLRTQIMSSRLSLLQASHACFTFILTPQFNTCTVEGSTRLNNIWLAAWTLSCADVPW